MPQINQHSILLGGIGGDSHSVGLVILRQAFSMNGYRVLYLGTQTKLEEFFYWSPLCNAVMISNMDGHAKYYLQQFPELVRKYGPQKSTWYLGGNLAVGDAVGYEQHFLELGFNRVWVNFVDVETVLATLKRDLYNVYPIAEQSVLWEKSRQQSQYLPSVTTDDRLELSTLNADRSHILDQWKTGHAARDINANAEFLGVQPSFPLAQLKVNTTSMPPLIQPRSGVALLDQQINLFKAFKNIGVKVMSYQVDSFTRNNDYHGAEQAIRDSNTSSYSLLNGFPVVNHGVVGLKRVISEIGVPLQTRHSTRDPRLLAEISYAGGVTAFEGGAICYNIPYYKDYRLQESIANWQYVDRLTGLYYERFGIVLDREFFGTLTGTLIEPCLAVVTNVLEAILAVQQGVKCVSLAYAEQGNRAQDIAAMQIMGEFTTEILNNMGYKDIQINTVFHQYMAAFPQVPQRAEELVYNSAITGAQSSATRILTKTAVEAFKIPSLTDNIQGLSLVQAGIMASKEQEINISAVAEEANLIRREAEMIFDSIVACGHGSVSSGITTAFEKGFIDIPFAPSIYNKGEVLTARDRDGAVRFLSTGNIPFDRDVREFHRDKIQARRHAEGIWSDKQDYLLVERDVLKIARGQYESWPLK